MPSLVEIRRALHGAWRLIFIDPRALLDFDGSAKGALHSFWVAAIVLPLNALVMAIPVRVLDDAPEPAPSIALTTAGTVAAWLVLLALVYALVRWYGRGERYWLFVCTFNWTQIPQAIAAAIAALLAAGAVSLLNVHEIASTPIGTSIVVGIAFILVQVLQVAIFAYEWYVAWVSLEAGILIPIIVVLLDFALQKSISLLIPGFA